MQTTFEEFSETKSQDAFALQNSKLLKVRLDEVRATRDEIARRVDALLAEFDKPEGTDP